MSMLSGYDSKCPKLPWMIDFHSTIEGVPNTQLNAAYTNTYTEHLINLNIESEVPKRKLTGIIATFGPSCDTAEILEKMMDAGMTMLQIKMCFCSNTECNNPLKLIRQANDKYSRRIGRVYPLAIGVEIRGPEIRTGSLKDPRAHSIKLEKGDMVCLTTDPAYEEYVTVDIIYVDFRKLTDVVESGDTVLLNNGEIRLSTIEIVGCILRCLVESAGTLTSNSSVMLPGVPVNLPALSEKDMLDIRYGMEYGVDAFFMSGIRDTRPIQAIKKTLGEECQNIMIISRIDNVQAIHAFEAILTMSDAIIIDRAALGKEMLPEKIFLAQKSLIAQCNRAGKPVICTAQVLESMIVNNQPLTSEIAGVANSVLDGADGFLLNNETAIGDYPIKCVETLTSICKEAEAAVYQKQVFGDLSAPTLSPIEPIYAISIAAVEASLKCNAAVIIVLTVTGRSASILARYRPRCPIIAITRFGHVARKLHIFRAINPIQYILPFKGEWDKDVEKRIQLGITWGKVSGFIRAGDAIVTVTGSRRGTGFTNLMKVVYASEFDALPPEVE